MSLKTKAGADPSILVGLVGRGIGQSRTPLMHEREGKRLGINYVYRKLDADEMGDVSLADIVTFAERFGFDGLNVTYPYKQEMMALLDSTSAEAQAMGSVNTVVLRDGKRVGHNTDWYGFYRNVQEGLGAIDGQTVLQLGAGGAGVAVAEALAQLGVKRLIVRDIDEAKAKGIAEALTGRLTVDVIANDAIGDAARDADGIVNATPVGMVKLPGMPIDAVLIEPRHFVADIIYFPLETELLAVARSKRCRTLSGEGMAIHQAVRAFELFCGEKPDTTSLRATFRSFDA